MNRERKDDLIELGAASVETKGGPVGTFDQEAGLILKFGLTND